MKSICFRKVEILIYFVAYKFQRSHENIRIKEGWFCDLLDNSEVLSLSSTYFATMWTLLRKTCVNMFNSVTLMNSMAFWPTLENNYQWDRIFLDLKKIFEVKQRPTFLVRWRFNHCLRPSTDEYTDITRTCSQSLCYICSFSDLAAVYFTNVFSDIIHVQMPFSITVLEKKPFF